MLFVDKKVLHDLTSNTGKISVVYVKVDDPKHMNAVIADLKSKLENYPVYSIDEFLSNFTTDNIPGLNAFIGTIVGLSIIFGFLVVFLAMYTAVLERTREIGILKAMGMTSASVRRIFFTQGLVIGLVGTLLGVLLGIGASLALGKYQFIKLNPEIYFIDHLPVATEAFDILVTIAASIGIAAIATLYPSRQAARLYPIEAIRHE
jgi:ABC-type lipoprotein release transport system permease subunit